MLKVVISNCWSFYNKGDAAITIATVKLIHKISPSTKITLLAVDAEGFNKHKDVFGCPVDVLPMAHVIHPFREMFILYSLIYYIVKGMTSFFGILYLLRQISLFPIVRLANRTLDRMLSEVESADLVIAVGGNYLYSNRSLFNNLLILIYAKFLRRKKLILLGHSIGPFKDKISAFTVKKILRYADYVFFREEISSHYVRNNLLELDKSKIVGDLAFLLEPSRRKKKERKKDLMQRNIGVSIRKWFHRRPVLFEKYVETMKDVIFSLVRTNFHVYIIPFSYIYGGEDDVEICRSIVMARAMALPTEMRDRISLLDLRSMAPSEIISLLNDLDLDMLLATRLHSAILASISNIPSVFISYQHFKAYGISKQLGLEDYVIRIDEVSPERISSYITDMYHNMDLVKKNLENRVQKIREKTYDDTCPIIKKMI